MRDQPPAQHDLLYIVVTGAGTARRVPNLIRGLNDHFEHIAVIQSENASRVISQRELTLIDGVQIVDSYFDDMIQPHPPEGIVLIAPCTFNSLNKLAHGIADTLALSIAAEAIGRGTPVIVAVSVNPPLFAHPRTQQSMDTLRSWGVSVVPPAATERWMTLADDETIIDTVLAARVNYPRG